MNHAKVAVAVNQTVSFVQILTGVFIVFLFGICTIIYLADREFSADVGVGFLVFCLFFDVLGIWLIRCSRRRAKLGKAFKRYVAVLSNDPNGYIPDIAASLGISEDVVKRDLGLMIKKKFFSNAFIDQNANCMIIEKKQAAPTPGTFSTAPAAEMVTVKCKGCGGMNMVAKGQTGECDYCGSAVKGE